MARGISAADFFEQVAPLHGRGVLVPFVGSGLSAPACASWPDMVGALEDAAGLEPAADRFAQLVPRAWKAVERLKRRGEDLPRVLRTAVVRSPDPPAKMRSLASINWPLVLTTNYDELFVRSLLERWSADEHAHRRRQCEHRLEVVGRSRSGCRRVLDQLDFATGLVVWAIQGLLTPAAALRRRRALDGVPSWQALEADLVVGHAEYREVTHQAPGFRRAFAEVFRRRSLLFLGSGLAEPYLLELLGEVLQLVGPAARPHFAVLPRGEVDADFLRSRFGVFVLEYDRDAFGRAPHAALDDLLEQLSERLVARRAGVEELRLELPRTAGDARVTLALRRDAMTRTLARQVERAASREWLAFSCGRRPDGTKWRDASGILRPVGRPYPSSKARYLAGIDTDEPDAHWTGLYSCTFGDRPWVRGVVARDVPDGPDDPRGSQALLSPRAVREAFEELLSQTDAEPGVERLHVQTLSAGRQRLYAGWVSLLKMAGALGRWSRTSPREEPLEVVVYGVDLETWRLLLGGSLDLLEPVRSSSVRLRLEVVDAHGDVEREHRLLSLDDSLVDLLDELGVRDDRWTAECWPRARVGARPMRLDAVREASPTVEDFGLVTGGRLLLRAPL